MQIQVTCDIDTAGNIKVVYIYLYINVYINKYYSTMIKKEILPFVTTWMNHENIILREVCWIDEVRYYIIYVYMHSPWA